MSQFVVFNDPLEGGACTTDPDIAGIGVSTP